MVGSGEMTQMSRAVTDEQRGAVFGELRQRGKSKQRLMERFGNEKNSICTFVFESMNLMCLSLLYISSGVDVGK